MVGASRGIGLGFVRHLIEDPKVARLFAACRHPDSAPELNRLDEANAQRLRVLSMDVTDEPSVAKAAVEIANESPRLDLLINCAGVLHEDGALAPERRIAEIEPGRLMRSFEVHAVGPALLAKHFAKLFDRRSRAVFASLSARVGSIGDNRLGGWVSYRASKAALNMVARTFAIEQARSHPASLVVTLHPGTTDTALSKPFQRNVPDGKLFTPPFVAERLLGVLDGLSPEDSGGFFAWDGSRIEY